MSGRAVLAFVASGVIVGCAGSRREPGGSTRTELPRSDGGASGARDAGPPEFAVPPVASVAARARRVAPGMRELHRLDPAPARSPDLLRGATADTCVRAAWSSSRPVRVGFVDAEGLPRGERAEGTVGAAPPGGPVCAARGESLHLVVEGEATARVVIWASP